MKVCSAFRFLTSNRSLYANVKFTTVKFTTEKILSTLVLHKDLNEEDGKEHANHTPGTDINPSIPDHQAVVMESCGVIDVHGSSFHSSDQMASAVQSRQGTILSPHGPIPVNVSNNPALWIGTYRWLFLHGNWGPEMLRKSPVCLKTFVTCCCLLAEGFAWTCHSSFTYSVFCRNLMCLCILHYLNKGHPFILLQQILSRFSMKI